jgi:hypothetical protein
MQWQLKFPQNIHSWQMRQLNSTRNDDDGVDNDAESQKSAN